MESDPREELVEHLPALRAFAVSLSRNSSIADDIVQDTIVKAWSNFDKFQRGTNLRAWLFTILRNTYYTNRRKANREVADVDGAFSAQLSEKPSHDGHMQLAEFRIAFAQLSSEHREALFLVGASGFSYEEAAQMCGVALGTMKSRVNRGRVKLAELMQIDESETLEVTDSATLAVVNSGRHSAF